MKKKKNQLFARVFSVLKMYSDSTKKELEKQGICYIIKDEEVLGRIAEVLYAGSWNEEKINYGIIIRNS